MEGTKMKWMGKMMIVAIFVVIILILMYGLAMGKNSTTVTITKPQYVVEKENTYQGLYLSPTNHHYDSKLYECDENAFAFCEGAVVGQVYTIDLKHDTTDVCIVNKCADTTLDQIDGGNLWSNRAIL